MFIVEPTTIVDEKVFDSLLLTFLIWLPIVGAIAVLIAAACRQNVQILRGIAVITTSLTLLLTVPLYVSFDNSSYALQFQENLPWIPLLNIRYHLGIDGISLAMIMLTNFTGFIVVIAACHAIRDRVGQYMATFLILQGVSVGIFAAADAILFYLFWEAMLIPMYLCIGIWGDKNRSYASIKFFLYTFLGSVLMLAAFLYLGIQAKSFAITHFYQLHLPLSVQILIFLAFFLAFAVKVPMWPLHTWLPDVHTAAPAGGSVVLAALMLKMGIYGFVRFSMPITPDASQLLDWTMIVLGLIAIVYIGLIAIVQKDMKRLIAYSSIAHMGFAVLACFMVYSIIAINNNIHDAYLSLEGGVVQMISHAFSTGALFLGVGILYERLHSRMIEDYRGIAKHMPIFAAFFMLFAMSNVGLPGTSGFVGEFMVILSAFQAHFWVAFFAASTMVLAAAYTLWLYKRVFFGTMKSGAVSHVSDITAVHIFIYSLLAFAVIGIGIYPNFLLNILHSSVDHILTLSIQHRL
ncbi:MAG: NADH-quinone oxidoreductase subunit M [Gammaproteobacteria bacterium]|nr:NADH-quinone oxidoreductase subunit M [Gammaproteobacteria bacterium]